VLGGADGDVWPMQHPELAVVCWSVAMLVVFAPLAVHLYRRKALG
jgi:ABC-2 type transport system permease protein